MSCKHHPGQDCSCYCRFFGCSPLNCSVGEVVEDETSEPSIVPASGAEPEFIVVPLDGTDGLVLTKETRQWIASRLLKGDSGPMYVSKGQIWTDASEDEDVRASMSQAVELGVEVRVATDEEQREALERWLVVSTPVQGSTMTLRTASTEPPPPAARSVLLLSRGGRSVERITGPLPGGWGYVVCSEGVAAEVLVSRDDGPGLRMRAGLIHELVDLSQGAADDVFESGCEHVGGPCASEGFYWKLYPELDGLLETVTEGYEAPEAFWTVLEGVVERRIEYRKEKP